MVSLVPPLCHPGVRVLPPVPLLSLPITEGEELSYMQHLERFIFKFIVVDTTYCALKQLR